MSTSYQDIDSRLKVIEDKVDFIMRSIKITKQEPSYLTPGQMIVSQTDLLGVYREVKALDGKLVQVTDKDQQEPTNG